MRYTRLFIFILAGIALPSVLFAQSAKNSREYTQSEKQITIDKKQLARDRIEVKEFETLLAAMDALDMPGAMDDFRRLNRRLRAAMKPEYDQAKRKVTQANREVRQSRREARGERQEARITGSLRDRAQAHDDRRDLRDDRRDRTFAKGRAERMGAIIEETENLHPALSEGKIEAIEKNRRLLGEFLELLHSDLSATQAELGEDRRERREDRRERRTDRRN